MLGLFGVQSDTSNDWYKDDDEFTKAWQQIIHRLKWVFADTKAPNAVIDGYNSLKGDGFGMTEGYATDCPIEKHKSQDIEIQYDIIESQEDD